MRVIYILYSFFIMERVIEKTMFTKIFLIFFGPPGSGKGTQAEMLSVKLSLPIVCPGELLRHEVEIKSSIGKKINPILSSGKLVSENTINKIVIKKLKNRQALKGTIFDGYPRNTKQLNFLIKNISNDRVYAILIDVSNKEVKQRLGSRRVCDCGAAYHLKHKPSKKQGICDLCGKRLYIRSDDRPDIISGRLKLYHKQTEPLLDYFNKRDKLIVINGEQSIKEVQRDIVKELKRLCIAGE